MVKNKISFKNHSHLAKELKQNKINTYYIFIGEENFLKEQYKNIIKKRLNITDPINESIYYPDNKKYDDIFNELETISFFSQNKLIILKDFDKFSTTFTNEIKNYLYQNNGQHCIIIYSNKFPWNTNSKNIENLIKNTYDFTLKKTEYSQFLEHFLKKNQKRITNEARQIILDITTNLYDLKNNIEKISLNADEREIIDVKDLNVLTTSGQSVNTYYFIDSLFERNINTSLKISQKLLKQGENIFAIIGLIRTYLIKLIKIKYGLLKKENLNTLFIKSNIPIYKKQIVLKQLKNLTLQKLIKNLQILSLYDFKLKTSSISQEHILKMIIIEFCK